MDEKTILLIPCPESKEFKAIAAVHRPVSIAINFFFVSSGRIIAL